MASSSMASDGPTGGPTDVAFAVSTLVFCWSNRILMGVLFQSVNVFPGRNALEKRYHHFGVRPFILKDTTLKLS